MKLRPSLFALVALIAVAPSMAAQEVVMLNDLVNGDFEESFKPGVGFTYSGGPPRQWKMAAPWWIGEGKPVSLGAGGKGQCLRISEAGEGVYQPVGLVPGLGGKLRVVGEARSADGGALVVSATDAAGTTARFTFRPPARQWTRFRFDAGSALQRAAGKPPTGPCEIRLQADGGPVLVDNVQALCAYKRVDPKAFCAKVLRDAAWAFDMQLRYATDTDRGVPLEVRLYDVRTGKPIKSVTASVHDDSVYRYLPLMYALTKDRRWRDIALAHARFAAEKCIDPRTGLPGAYDPATGKLDPTHATGPLEYVQLFAWAARESGDPRFAQAIRTVSDAYLRYTRLENGRLCNSTYPDGRRHFANGEDYRCYDMLPVQALAVAYDATGDRKYAAAARDALKPFMERGQWKEWFDDPFGIPMNGTLAAYLLTGQPEMLEATRQGAEFWFDEWVNALQHGAWCAGDDPRTWPIYCYLGVRDKKREYIQTAKKHLLYVMKCQAFGGHWVEQYHFQYRPYPGFEYPPFNAMNGAGTIYEFTRDRDVLTRLAALYDDWNAFFRSQYGYRFTPDPKQPETTQWMHGNTARVMGTVLRTVAAIKGVRVTPSAYLVYPASKREATALPAPLPSGGGFYGILGPSADTASRPKKLIYYGWGTRDTIYVRQHWQEMERMPFDGIGISVAIDRSKPTTGDGATVNLLEWNLFGPKAFRWENFRPAIADLKAAKWRRFTDNFLVACVNSQGQDQGLSWFDDARWKTIVNNWRILARIAKEGGCKGIIFDPEDYGGYLFHYGTMKARADRPFAEYEAKARQRGRELMEATRRIFPDITLLMFWGHSYFALHPTDRQKPVEQSYYGLLPAFMDGMLESADERAKFVDINELAYGFKERSQFQEAYRGIREESPRLSAVPELYRRKVRAGFGLWIDNGRWNATDPSKNHFTPEEFRQALQSALEISDGYVWIYSQVPRFFPPEHLPDAYLQAIARAKENVQRR